MPSDESTQKSDGQQTPPASGGAKTGGNNPRGRPSKKKRTKQQKENLLAITGANRQGTRDFFRSDSSSESDEEVRPPAGRPGGSVFSTVIRPLVISPQIPQKGTSVQQRSVFDDNKSGEESVEKSGGPEALRDQLQAFLDQSFDDDAITNPVTTGDGDNVSITSEVARGEGRRNDPSGSAEEYGQVSSPRSPVRRSGSSASRRDMQARLSRLQGQPGDNKDTTEDGVYDPFFVPRSPPSQSQQPATQQAPQPVVAQVHHNRKDTSSDNSLSALGQPGADGTNRPAPSSDDTPDASRRPELDRGASGTAPDEITVAEEVIMKRDDWRKGIQREIEMYASKINNCEKELGFLYLQASKDNEYLQGNRFRRDGAPQGNAGIITALNTLRELTGKIEVTASGWSFAVSMMLEKIGELSDPQAIAQHTPILTEEGDGAAPAVSPNNLQRLAAATADDLDGKASRMSTIQQELPQVGKMAQKIAGGISRLQRAVNAFTGAVRSFASKANTLRKGVAAAGHHAADSVRKRVAHQSKKKRGHPRRIREERQPAIPKTQRWLDQETARRTDDLQSSSAQDNLFQEDEDNINEHYRRFFINTQVEPRCSNNHLRVSRDRIKDEDTDRQIKEILVSSLRKAIIEAENKGINIEPYKEPAKLSAILKIARKYNGFSLDPRASEDANEKKRKEILLELKENGLLPNNATPNEATEELRSLQRLSRIFQINTAKNGVFTGREGGLRKDITIDQIGMRLKYFPVELVDEVTKNLERTCSKPNTRHKTQQGTAKPDRQKGDERPRWTEQHGRGGVTITRL